MIKLFVSDIDGTLLNEQHELSQNVVEAVQKMRAKGVHFMPCSGREHDSLLKVIEEIDVPKCICLNGAEYRDNEGKVLAHFPMQKSACKQIVAIIEEYDLDVLYFYDNGKYTLKDGPAILQKFIRCANAFDEGGHSEFNENDVFFTTIEHVDSLEEVMKHDICKFELLFDSKQLKQEVCAKLEKIDGILLTYSHSFNVELNDTLANKGNMVAKVCEIYDYQKEEVLVIGDGHNDISMLSAFPHSVAMGQASQEVKDSASYVTRSNKEDGIVDVIEGILAKM